MWTTVRSKMIAGLVFIGVIVGAMALYATSVNRETSRTFDEFIEARSRISALADAETMVLKTTLHAMDAIVAAKRGDINEEDLKEIEAFDAEMKKSLPRIIGPDAPASSAQLLADWSSLVAMIKTDLRTAIKAKNVVAFEGLDDKIDDTSQKIREPLDKYREVLGTQFDGESAAGSANLASANVKLNVVALLTLAVIVGIGFGLEVLLLRPLRSAVDGMRRLSEGDVSIAVAGLERADEIGDISRALGVFTQAERERRKLVDEQQVMVEQTKQVARGVQTNASQVAGAATEASSAIQQIAQGVQQQVSALQQVGTAIGQSVRAINEINANAMTARDNAGSLQTLSQEGLTRVATLSAIVARSAEASEQIRQITQVIDAISRKTNLLSLNAQIEAANAGEVGRGFAVVANEVQTLADNVARSASEIASSVEQIITDVKSITGSAEAVNEIIAQFQDSARTNANLMMSVSAAVEETEATVTEINASMDQIGQISRSNAASTEELSATMHDLASVADNMRRQVETMV